MICFLNNIYIFLKIIPQVRDSRALQLWFRMSQEVAEIMSYRAVSPEGLTGAGGSTLKTVELIWLCKEASSKDGSFRKAA